MVVSELVNKISFVGSLEPLDRLNAGLSTSIKAIGLSSVAFGGAGIALNSWVSSTTEAITQTSKLSNDLGVGIESLQQWEYVAKMSGGSAEGLQESMRGLAERVGEFAKFDSGEGKEVFTALGISVKDSEGKVKSADLVMQDLRKSMQGLGASEQISIANKLGLDKSMLGTLRLTDEQFLHLQDRAKGLGIVTEEQAKQVDKYKKSLIDLNHGLSSIQMQLAIAFTPALENTANMFTELLIGNKDLIQNGLQKTMSVLMSFGSALYNNGKLIYDAIDYTLGFDNVLMGLGLAILYVNRAMYLNPMALLVAGIVLAIGVVDDLMVAFEGGESVIADFFASFDIDIVKALTGAFDVLKGTWNGLIAIALRLSESVLALFAILEKGGKFAGVDFGLGIEEQYGKIKGLREEYQKLSEQQLNGAFKDGISVNPVTDKKLTEITAPKYNDIGVVHNAPDVKQIPLLNQNAILPNSITNNANNNNTAVNNNNQSNVFNFEIKSDNPVAVGQTVRDNINKELSNANKQFNVGGL